MFEGFQFALKQTSGVIGLCGHWPAGFENLVGCLEDLLGTAVGNLFLTEPVLDVSAAEFTVG